MVRAIPDLEIWVLMVAGGWPEVGGRGKMEDRRRGDEGEKFWGMKNVQKEHKKNKNNNNNNNLMCNATFRCRPLGVES